MWCQGSAFWNISFENQLAVWYSKECRISRVCLSCLKKRLGSYEIAESRIKQFQVNKEKDHAL